MKRTILMVAAVVAVCMAGSATAASLIGSADVKNGSLTGVDVKNNSLTGADVRGISYADLTSGLKHRIDKSPVVNAPKGDAGATGAKGADGVGAAGPAGAEGPAGAAGASGISGYEVRTYDYIAGGARPGHDGEGSGYGGAGNSSVATVACSSEDKVATGGGYFIRGGVSEVVQSPEADGAGVGVVASFPGRMNWDTLEPKPDRLDGWIVQFNGNGGPAFDVTLYVVCVDAG